jgi:hypothetical protein
LVDRGNCTFVTKARNVQNIGGHIALIVNDNSDEAKEVVIVDDGTGQDIWIQAVLISQKDGEIIKEFLKDNENNKDLLNKLVISIEYQMVK